MHRGTGTSFLFAVVLRGARADRGLAQVAGRRADARREGAKFRPAERDEVPRGRAPRGARRHLRHRVRRRLGQRGAEHHRHLPPYRAHDVQRHGDDGDKRLPKEVPYLRQTDDSARRRSNSAGRSANGGSRSSAAFRGRSSRIQRGREKPRGGRQVRAEPAPGGEDPRPGQLPDSLAAVPYLLEDQGRSISTCS